MAIETVPSTPPGDKVSTTKSGGGAHKAGTRQAPHFAMALESLLGEGSDGAAQAPRSASKGGAAPTDSMEPGTSLVADLPSPVLPAPARPAQNVGTQACSAADAAPSASRRDVPAGLGLGDTPALGKEAPAPLSAASANGASAPPLAALAGAVDEQTDGTPSGSEAPTSDGRPSPAALRRPGTSTRPVPGADRAAPQRWPFMAPQDTTQNRAAQGSLSAVPPGGADIGATRTLSGATVRVLGGSTGNVGEAEPAGAAMLSTLAFAGEPGARRAVRGEPRVELAPNSPGAELLGSSGESASTDAALAQPSAADVSPPSEEAPLAPHWSAETGKETQLRIQDMPGGPLEVRIQLSGNDASVGFSSAENATRAALADSSAALSELLLQEGIRLVDVSVQAGLGGSAQQQEPSRHGAPESPVGALRSSDAAGTASVGTGAPGAPGTRASAGRLDVFV